MSSAAVAARVRLGCEEMRSLVVRRGWEALDFLTAQNETLTKVVCSEGSLPETRCQIDAAEAGLVDLRLLDAFKSRSASVREAALQWGPVPGEQTVDRLLFCTDGSGEMTKGFPKVPISAGFGVVCFGSLGDEHFHFGSFWAPVICSSSQYANGIPSWGAQRPTAPVGEVSAAIAVLVFAREQGWNVPLRSSLTVGRLDK